jgi:LPS-assembly protein
VKNLPILYTPYFIYPVKTERETGFLVPDFGFNSKMGAFIQPRFYWNIDVDQDATFTSMIASSKSPLSSIEHRYRPKADDSIYTYVEFTSEDKRYPENKNGEYSLSKENNRYFLYNKTNLSISDNLSLKAKIDTVSDYEYMDDYRNYSQHSNYNNTTDSYYTSAALSFVSEYADIDLKYIDDMEYNVGAVYSKEHTYSAPRLTLQKSIIDFPVYFKYFIAYDKVRHTEYVYNYSENKNYNKDIRYDREHAYLNVYKPFNLYIGTLTPSLKLYKTRWHNPKNYSFASNDDDAGYAKIKTGASYAERDFYTLEHTFAFNKISKAYNSYKHSIYNTITYKQSPMLDQSALPDYIYEDHLEWEKKYVYEISNYFNAKDWNVLLKNSQEYTLLKEKKNEQQFMTQLHASAKRGSFYFKHKYNTHRGDTDELHTNTRINFSPVVFNAVYSFDRDDYQTGSNNTTAAIGGAYISKKYDLEYTKSVSGSNDKLNWANFTDKKDTLTIRYKKDCWALGVSYIRDTRSVSIDINDRNDVEHTIMFTITLRGLGKYKSSFMMDKENGDDDEI